MGEVKLHGSWSSPSTYGVIWALSLKGIPYEFVERDLTNKTPLLLHEKVPMLVHGGKPIFESDVILEYIDETWMQNPLLPTHPLDRGAARSWIRFIQNKRSVVWKMLCYEGEEQKKAKREILEMLQILEEQGIGEGKFFNGEKIGIVDLAYGVLVEWLGVIEDVTSEKVMEANSFPQLHAWSMAFMEAPTIRENRPNREWMVMTFKHLREHLLKKPRSSEVSLKDGILFCELFQCVLDLISLLCNSL
ncbi:probable glutathione S-transferase [Momordica charantia]|uniref:glutathione transferase n=1 Tax=Momordica charantia TaxID=3673 RepID=A0A6J1DZP8_MOMCH|nr:probable glutathione S-transferase [Momordica charantia]